MKKYLKKAFSLTLAMACVLSLAACSSSSGSSDSSDDASIAVGDDGVKTITYTFRYDSDNITAEEADASRNGMIKGGFELLEEQLGGEVKFVIEYLPKLEIADLAMQAAGGVEADLFLDEETAIGQGVKGDLMAEVDWFLDLENVQGNISQQVIDMSMYEGHLYGIPVDLAPNMLYANKNMLKELGWTDADIEAWPGKVASGEWTMDDMIATAKEAMDQGIAKYGFMMDGVDNCASFTLASAFGFDMVDDETGNLIVTDEWISVFEKWDELVNVSGVTPTSLTSFEGTYETFYKGETLFFPDVSGYQYWQRNSNMDKDEFAEYYAENFTQALFPSAVEGEPGVVGTKVRSLFVSPQVQGEKLEYLQQAINLAYTPENVTSAVLDQVRISVLTNATDSPEIADHAFLSDCAYMTDYVTVRPAHPDFNTKYGAYYRTQVEGIIVDKISPEQAWENMKAEIEFNISEDQLTYK